jgi:hypothetical protein
VGYGMIQEFSWLHTEKVGYGMMIAHSLDDSDPFGKTVRSLQRQTEWDDCEW